MSVLDQKKKEQNKDGVVVVPVIVSKSSVTHSMESASLVRSQSRLLNKRETGTSLMDLGNTSSDDDDLTVKAKVQKKKKLAKSLDFFAIFWNKLEWIRVCC